MKQYALYRRDLTPSGRAKVEEMIRDTHPDADWEILDIALPDPVVWMTPETDGYHVDFPPSFDDDGRLRDGIDRGTFAPVDRRSWRDWLFRRDR